MARNSLQVVARLYNENEDYCLFAYDCELDKPMTINIDCPEKSEVLTDWCGYDYWVSGLLHAKSIEYVDSNYVDILVKEVIDAEEDKALSYDVIRVLMEFKEF